MQEKLKIVIRKLFSYLVVIFLVFLRSRDLNSLQLPLIKDVVQKCFWQIFEHSS
jgi:hypothetical protein